MTAPPSMTVPELLEMLRRYAGNPYGFDEGAMGEVMEEAADEIERLLAALNSLENP